MITLVRNSLAFSNFCLHFILLCLPLFSVYFFKILKRLPAIANILSSLIIITKLEIEKFPISSLFSLQLLLRSTSLFLSNPFKILKRDYWLSLPFSLFLIITLLSTNIYLVQKQTNFSTGNYERSY